jgi:hypothetical protein
MQKIKEHAGIVRYPIEVPPVSEFLNVDGEQAVGTIACKYLYHVSSSFSTDLVEIVWEFKHHSIPRFLKYQCESKVQSLQDIINFNEKYKDLALREREHF